MTQAVEMFARGVQEDFSAREEAAEAAGANGVGATDEPHAGVTLRRGTVADRPTDPVDIQAVDLESGKTGRLSTTGRTPKVVKRRKHAGGACGGNIILLLILIVLMLAGGVYWFLLSPSGGQAGVASASGESKQKSTIS